MCVKNNKNVAVLITCHNRKEKTKKCLECFFNETKSLNYNFKVFLVDDGCTDGTAEMVQNEFQQVKLLRSNGNLFWNKGMNLAWVEASKEDYDFYFWLNDDVNLYSKSLSLLLSEIEIIQNGIICGICEDENGDISYSGYNTKDKIRIKPNNRVQECDYFNGNIVIVPKAVFYEIGFLDDKYSHSIGDFDYGLRAKKNGYKSYVSSHIVGLCNRNSNLPQWCDYNLSLNDRIKSFKTPLGYSPNENLYFEAKHFNWFIAILHFITIYIRLFLPILWKHKKS